MMDTKIFLERVQREHIHLKHSVYDYKMILPIYKYDVSKKLAYYNIYTIIAYGLDMYPHYLYQVAGRLEALPKDSPVLKLCMSLIEVQEYFKDYHHIVSHIVNWIAANDPAIHHR